MKYDRNGQINRVANVKQLLFPIGLGNIWQNPEHGVYTDFLNVFSQRLKDNYLQSWQEKINISSKCNLYSMYTNSINTELYLSCLNVKWYRVCLARFRCSSHDLFIEKGRYVNITCEKGICKLVI